MAGIIRMGGAMSTAGTGSRQAAAGPAATKEPIMRFEAALITGATSGIGEAIARVLPATTALWLTGRDVSRLAALAAELGEAERPVATFAADLATRGEQDAMIAWAAAAPIDLLVNNAGFGRFGPALERGERDRAMIEVNLLAPMALAQALLPGMLERARSTGRRAGLINVASVVGFFPWPYFATYAASKAFLVSWTEALAAELRDDPIDVLALCPGATTTKFHERAGYAGVPGWGSHSPDRVAREALEALGRRPVHVVGVTNRIAVAAIRYLPRWLTMRGTARATARSDRR